LRIIPNVILLLNDDDNSNNIGDCDDDDYGDGNRNYDINSNSGTVRVEKTALSPFSQTRDAARRVWMCKSESKKRFENGCGSKVVAFSLNENYEH
jgi:hypothetical protein